MQKNVKNRKKKNNRKETPFNLANLSPAEEGTSTSLQMEKIEKTENSTPKFHISTVKNVEHACGGIGRRKVINGPRN